MKTLELSQDISRLKKKLIAQTKKAGYLHENFGQKELRNLEDRSRYTVLCYGNTEERTQAQLITDFRAWIENYTGEEN